MLQSHISIQFSGFGHDLRWRHHVVDSYLRTWDDAYFLIDENTSNCHWILLTIGCLLSPKYLVYIPIVGAVKQKAMFSILKVILVLSFEYSNHKFIGKYELNSHNLENRNACWKDCKCMLSSFFRVFEFRIWFDSWPYLLVL